MVRYTIGISSVAAASAAPYLTLHTGATRTMHLRELKLSVQTSVLSQVGLFRPSNTPVATTSKLGQAGDPNDPAATVNSDTAWSTAPTVGSNIALQQWSLGATAGSGIIFTWDPGEIVLGVSSWLVLWNYGSSTASALDVSARWDER